jgi:putative nucleotidyltransferase with HDIG domain
MDLRDKETEGHTLRVTAMTLKLAQRLGITGEELIHIRRGALLHDIGKMGVPDRILLKPDSLNDEELLIMRRHPQYAADMLLPIDYLRPALTIPYSHHERWDGSGYPQGLKGREIPIAARLFAVIDVWDALTSDRPYRPAWTNQETLNYIVGLSGIQFDPVIVTEFLKMLAEGIN